MFIVHVSLGTRYIVQPLCSVVVSFVFESGNSLGSDVMLVSMSAAALFGSEVHSRGLATHVFLLF